MASSVGCLHYHPGPGLGSYVEVVALVPRMGFVFAALHIACELHGYSLLLNGVDLLLLIGPRVLLGGLLESIGLHRLVYGVRRDCTVLRIAGSL